ncbi:PIN domain-containing protein [Rhodovulum sp. DZ06]|uniref:PIN domain-containing protein n=1 Tax=Rhodovulum sp. DZ06 TaxID=3425126 RepID=UPI003D329E8E
MLSDPFGVVIDANILYGAFERDICLSLAAAGYFRPFWSERILDEFERAFANRRNDSEGALRQRAAIQRAFPGALTPAAACLPSINLPDRDDVHVVHCAMSAGAQLIVTENLKDFPKDTLRPIGIDVVGFDAFLADLVDLDPRQTVVVLRKMRTRLKCPPLTASEFIARLESRNYMLAADVLIPYEEFL